MTKTYRTVMSSAGLALGLYGLAILGSSDARAQAAQERRITGNQFTFTPSRIEVQKDDLVKITFTATDIAHSFTINDYKISKRAGAGQTVVIEFRADQAGTFTFYCNLTEDARCKDMKGQLVVR